MAFNWDLRVPFGYGNNYVSLRWLESWLLEHHHPEYVRRLLAWLHYKGGKVGVGGGWRAGGAQPDKPGFAPEGKSFHQDQEYNDGFTGACAVDTVYEDGPDPGDAHDGIAWREVPQQGTADAAKWGVHANVGVPGNGESWHIQPVEIDGWQTWWNSGRPAPRPGYPIPAEHDPYLSAPPEETSDMETLQPRRVIDTRGEGASRDQYKARPDTQHDIRIPEAKGYKAGQVSFTVIDADNAGHLTQWKSGARPETSFLNYERGAAPVTETLFVQLDSTGTFQVWTYAGVHLVVDFTGLVAR